MQRFWKYAACAAAILVVAPGAALAQAAKAPAKAKASPAAGTAGKGRTAQPATLGGHPNLNGVWQVMNTADWDPRPHDAGQAPVAAEKLGAWGAVPPGLGVIVGDTDVPYKAEARAQYQANHTAGPAKDPEAACYLPGI